MRHKWKAICDRCGFEYYSYQLREEWNGLMTCRACWEPRHPQDFVRAVPDRQTVPWTRPEPLDIFIELNDSIYWDAEIPWDASTPWDEAATAAMWDANITWDSFVNWS